MRSRTSKRTTSCFRLLLAIGCTLLICGSLFAVCEDGCYLTKDWNDWDNDWHSNDVVCITYSSDAAGLPDKSPFVCKAVRDVQRAPQNRWRYCAKQGALGATNTTVVTGDFAPFAVETKCLWKGS